VAEIFPSTLPDYILQDRKRSAEVNVYHSLKEQLGDRYVVFYTSPWLGTNRDGSEKDGEADFLIAHPESGFLSIEVKGGRISVTENNQWRSTDRAGITYNIKDPVMQASTSKHQILQKLKDSPVWNPKFIRATHAVFLPDNSRPGRDLRPHAPLKIFAFDDDMVQLQAFIERRFRDAAADENDRAEPLGPEGVAALRDILSRPIELHVRVKTEVWHDLKEIQLRTDDQVELLEEMSDTRRMSISGAAGTGKTVLAMEKAASLIENNPTARVLLLCFNEPLGVSFVKTFADNSQITATHFHSFCRSVALKAGMKEENLLHPEVAAEELMTNFGNSGLAEYDAVIIDEGQDFQDPWLESLEVILTGGSNGVYYVFYDNNQKVTRKHASYIDRLSEAKRNLSKNFRNTQTIHRASLIYYQGRPVRAIGPFGKEIVLLRTGSSAQIRTLLSEQLGLLVKQEGLEPRQIAVLFENSNFLQEVIGDRRKIIAIPITSAGEMEPGSFVVDTIRRFKGLEAPVVILLFKNPGAEIEELLYVGITRAQSLLILAGPAYLIDEVKLSGD